MPVSRRRNFLAAVALAVALPAVQAQAPTAEEVKAAYLHKFPGFISWPDDAFPGPHAPLLVGVVGADRVATELARIAQGRPVQGRDIVVKRLARFDPAEGLHLLFIGADAPEPVARTLAITKGLPIVTVTEVDKGLPPGAVLNFVTQQGRVRFEAANGTAELAGLKLSSRLLSVAERVVGEQKP